MQEFGVGAEVTVVNEGRGFVTQVELYPDGDLHFYVVQMDHGRTLECAEWEVERF